MEFMAVMINAPVFVGKLISLRFMPHDSIRLFSRFFTFALDFWSYLQPCELRGVTLIVLVFS
jgi:hypothetical protein